MSNTIKKYEVYSQLEDIAGQSDDLIDQIAVVTNQAKELVKQVLKMNIRMESVLRDNRQLQSHNTLLEDQATDKEYKLIETNHRYPPYTRISFSHV